MFEKIRGVLRNVMQRNSKKKLIENCIIIGIVGMIVVIAGGSLFGDKKSQPGLAENKDSPKPPEAVSCLSSSPQQIEKSLEAILERIKGVGKVNVMIAYTSGQQIVPAYEVKKSENVTNEKDNGGGTRNISQNSYETKVVYEDGENGTKRPIIIREISPEVRGVIVVADGASDSTVKEDICRAVEVATGLPIHKIHVSKRDIK